MADSYKSQGCWCRQNLMAAGFSNRGAPVSGEFRLQAWVGSGAQVLSSGPAFLASELVYGELSLTFILSARKLVSSLCALSFDSHYNLPGWGF